MTMVLWRRMMSYMLLVVVIGILGPLCQGWHLVMKVPQGPTDLGNHNSVYDLWMSDETLNPDTENAMAVLPGITYKSRDVIEWENRSISLVKVAFYRGADEVAFIVFGAAGPTYNHSSWPFFKDRANVTSWFDCSRIMYTTFSNLELFPSAIPEFCSLHSVSALEHSFSILSSGIDAQADCDNLTGWFTVLEPNSTKSDIDCGWQLGTSPQPPYFLYAEGNTSELMKNAVRADVMAIFVDDCINKTLCHSPDCWQDPMGNCLCHGYPCVSSCSKLPCPDHTICQPNPTNMSEHTCECLYGIQGDTCQAKATVGMTPGVIIGIVLAVLILIGLCAIAIFGFYKWRHRNDLLKDEDEAKDSSTAAGFARDFVRRSVHRLSGRNSQFSRRHLKEEKSSPDTQARIKNNSSNKTLGKSEQLSPDSSVVFGEANPAFQDDDSPPTPQPTPPIDRRYTEFPTRTVALQSVAPPSVSVTEIQMHEKKQGGSVFSQNKNAQRRYENVPLPPVIDAKMRRESPHVFEASERASTIGSFEKASTMSELSDATSTSGFSDYTGDGPANLPPSEMISKDMIRHHGHHRHKVRSRPRSRASTADQPKPIVAPETVEGQINYAMERSRLSISSMSSLSSEATHKSDSTQRSGEVTKSDILRARYELSHPRESAGRFAHNKGLSYQEIKRQLDADMRRREAREKKMLEEMDEDAKYEEERTKKQKMRQVESLDSGIDAEHNSADRNSDGKIQIIRARSADELNRNRGLTVNYSSKEATV
ncbi:uncharacterized protein LOC128207679 [Mya arenaria]|uniref:uncharacterized protein LOC128207679 n=1 Tax=Mya arenaria TaxID=6604 RepID=UPI0022E50B17|nr:uncharacterized protein LOC128207679 [Mya arenaria]